LKLSVHQNTLVIEGEKLASGKGLKPEAFHRSERAAGRFIRSIELPMGIDATKVTADYTNGLLMVTLPKMEQVKPRQIDVTIG